MYHILLRNEHITVKAENTFNSAKQTDCGGFAIQPAS